MVGYNVDSLEKPKLSHYHHVIAGGISGAATRALSQPLDVLKIRLQLQVEPICHGSKYSSTFQAARLIFKEEGVKALWSGHIPAQYLSITYGITQFSLFESLTEICHNSSWIPHNMINTINFASGALSASLATFLCFPFDTVRTRLVAEQKTRPVYKGVLDVILKMIKTEGIFSLYRGLVPTVFQMAPHVGMQFTVYKFITDALTKAYVSENDATKRSELPMIANLFAGSVAGLSAKILIYPFDLSKKRLQIQGFQQHRVTFGQQFYCISFKDCLIKTVHNEGYKGLFKGLAPSLIKAVTATALHFSIYEEVKKLLLRHIS